MTILWEVGVKDNWGSPDVLQTGQENSGLVEGSIHFLSGGLLAVWGFVSGFTISCLPKVLYNWIHGVKRALGHVELWSGCS